MIEFEVLRFEGSSPNTYTTISGFFLSLFPAKRASKLRSGGSEPLWTRSGQLPFIKSPASAGPRSHISPIGSSLSENWLFISFKRSTTSHFLFLHSLTDWIMASLSREIAYCRQIVPSLSPLLHCKFIIACRALLCLLSGIFYISLSPKGISHKICIIKSLM